MPRAKTTEYFSGQGVVYLANRDAVTGLPTGFTDIGNVTDLKLSFKTNVIEHKESRTGSRMIDLRLATDKSCEASMTMDSFDADTLCKAMFGTLTTVASGTGVNEAAIIARLGKVVPLSKIKVSNVVIAGTGAKSAKTYVVDKNYTVDVNSGSIYFFTAAEQTAASAVDQIADADVVSITYNHAAQESIETFKAAQGEYVLRFEGLNTAQDNEPVIVTIHKFRPDPLKDLSLITNDLNKFELSGAALMDTANGNKFATIQKL